MFRWVDAVDVIERAVAELGDADPELTDQLRAQLVVAGLHDARRAAPVASVLKRMAARPGPVPPDEAWRWRRMVACWPDVPRSRSPGLRR